MTREEGKPLATTVAGQLDWQSTPDDLILPPLIADKVLGRIVDNASQDEHSIVNVDGRLRSPTDDRHHLGQAVENDLHGVQAADLRHLLHRAGQCNARGTVPIGLELKPASRPIDSARGHHSHAGE